MSFTLVKRRGRIKVALHEVAKGDLGPKSILETFVLTKSNDGISSVQIITKSVWSIRLKEGVEC